MSKQVSKRVLQLKSKLLDKEKKKILDLLIKHFEDETSDCVYNKNGRKLAEIKFKFFLYNNYVPCCYTLITVDKLNYEPISTELASMFTDLLEFLDTSEGKRLYKQDGFFKYTKKNSNLYYAIRYSTHELGSPMMIIKRDIFIEQLIISVQQHRDSSSTFFRLNEDYSATCLHCNEKIYSLLYTPKIFKCKL